MKLKLYQIKQFSDIYEKIKTAALPIKVAYRFAKIAAQAQKEMELYQSQLSEIILKYGARDDKGELIRTEDGTGIKVAEGKLDECQKAITELADIEIEFNCEPISIESFGDDLKFTLEEITILTPFLVEE